MVQVIIIVIIILIVLIGSISMFKKIVRNINKNLNTVNNIVNNVTDIVDFVKENEAEIATTPKTLSVKESLYLESLKNDFPELNIPLTKTYVNEIISDYLNYLYTKDVKELKKDCTENFIVQANSFKLNQKPQNLKFHRTVISDYKKNNEEAQITYQVACEYKIGEKIKQTRYEITYIYFLEETMNNKTISLRCSNCNGPIEYTGEKICKFCGCRLIDTIKRSWKFNSIKEF